MSASIREQVLLAIVAALGGTGTPASQVTRSRLDQLELKDLPCYDVTPGIEAVAEGDYGDQESVTHTLPVTVRAILDAGQEEGENTDPTVDIDDSALDPFYVFAVQSILAGDEWLGGLANDVRFLSVEPVFRPECEAIIGHEMKFEVIFSTKRGDPTQKG